MDFGPYKSVSGLRALLTSSFPEFEINGLEVIAHGWDNLVVKANGNTIFRFPRVSGDEVKLRREIRLLSNFQDFPVQVPKYRYISKGSPFFAGYSFIPGNPLNTAVELKPRLLNDMVKVLQKLRSFSAEWLNDIGLPVYTPENWIERQRKVVENFEIRLSPYASKNLFMEVRNLLESAMQSIPERSFNLVHADMFRGNILINASMDRIVGIIDWEDAFVGDMALDIAALGLDFGSQGTAKLLGALGPGREDPGLEGRVKFYQKIEFMYLAEHFVKTGEIEQAKQLLKSPAIKNR